jgi:hypothetical protein
MISFLFVPTLYWLLTSIVTFLSVALTPPLLYPSLQVVYVSVAKPNRPLLQLLMQRRRLLQSLLLNGSACAERVGDRPDDPEGFYIDDAAAASSASDSVGHGGFRRRGSHTNPTTNSMTTSSSLMPEQEVRQIHTHATHNTYKSPLPSFHFHRHCRDLKRC